MKKILKTPIYILVGSLFFMAFQCDEEVMPEVEYQYNFVEHIELYPAKKSYKVGDTIWAEFNNSDRKLFDFKSNKEIGTDSVSLGFFIGLEATYYAPASPVGGFYDYVTENANNLSSHTGTYGAGVWFTFGCNPSYSQRFRIGLKLKHKGIYKLHLQNTNDAGSNKLAVTSCPTKRIPLQPSTIDYKFNLTDVNKEIYMSIPPVSRGESENGYTEGKIDRKEIFMIKVE